MKTKNLTQQQKESIKHLGILELFEGCKESVFLKKEINRRKPRIKRKWRKEW